MRVFTIILFVLIISGCEYKSPAVVDYNPKEELSKQLGGAVLWYQNSAEAYLLYHQAYDKAHILLKNKLDKYKGDKKPAIVLDIDETMLDNSPYEGMLIKEGLTFNSETWKEWVELRKAAILPGVEKFVKTADSLDVEVFYISNRSVDMLKATIDNMNQYNLPNADSAHIFLKSETSDKTKRRSKITEDHEVLVFVGDNLTDYSQLFADRDFEMGKNVVNENLEELLNNFIMLPNPMYGEWESALYDNDYSKSDSVKIQMREGLIKDY